MNFIRHNQQKIALAIGFVAVATLGFWGGVDINKQAPQPTVSASSSSTSNYTQEIPPAQTTSATAIDTQTPAPADLNCQGKIKGSSSHIYHMPGGAFYDKTTHPIACFDTEAEAQAAGFRKSSR
ncbi:MAG TPA: hypothetical protein VFX17_01750 [Patescibacteria group bacterium]|nr:hypothetical protein [Patescibacteria group bacterium]